VIFFQFATGFLTYLGLATASYSKSFQASRWYLPVGIAAAVLANFIWLSIARSEPSASSLVIKGLIWDVILTGTYLLVPILWFGAALTNLQCVGIGFVILGIILTKV
jgi:multidrug transporter EmrE-like cation transporter